MQFKKIIPIFLLLVLCIQLLPLKQTIAWLLGNQVTEELVHTHDGKDSRYGDDLNKHFLPVHYPSIAKLPAESLCAGYNTDEALTGRHADDVMTPPPNC